MLLDAGAWPEISARGEGGTPLIAALFWGHRRVTDVLAAEGVLPRSKTRSSTITGALARIASAIASEGRESSVIGAPSAVRYTVAK